MAKVSAAKVSAAKVINNHGEIPIDILTFSRIEGLYITGSFFVAKSILGECGRIIDADGIDHGRWPIKYISGDIYSFQKRVDPRTYHFQIAWIKLLKPEILVTEGIRQGLANLNWALEKEITLAYLLGKNKVDADSVVFGRFLEDYNYLLLNGETGRWSIPIEPFMIQPIIEIFGEKIS